MPHSTQEWQNTWNEFFKSVGDLVARRTGSLPAGPVKGFVDNHAPAIIGSITDNRNWPAIWNAIDQSREPNHPYIEDALYDELRALAAVNSGVQVSDDRATSRAVDDTETGKGSIEDLLGKWLPDWLKKLLKLLNEILKLIKP